MKVQQSLSTLVWTEPSTKMFGCSNFSTATLQYRAVQCCPLLDDAVTCHSFVTQNCETCLSVWKFGNSENPSGSREIVCVTIFLSVTPTFQTLHPLSGHLCKSSSHSTIILPTFNFRHQMSPVTRALSCITVVLTCTLLKMNQTWLLQAYTNWISLYSFWLVELEYHHTIFILLPIIIISVQQHPVWLHSGGTLEVKRVG